MRKALTTTCIAVTFASQAAAFECTFTTECFETDSCSDTQFSMDVDVPLQTVTTDFGDLGVVAVQSKDGNFILFASGDGAEYMLTTNEGGARLSTHLTDGPMVVTYHGRCEDHS